jgi:hypothetical protein
MFPTLYCKSGQQDTAILAIGSWYNDIWAWTDELTVKSAYLQLQNRYVLEDIVVSMTPALQSLWKNNVPSKVSIFGRRLLLEKL